MRTLEKLMIATVAMVALSAPVFAWDSQAEQPARTEAEETMVVKASQPSHFCYDAQKCTDAPLTMVNDLERFDTQMKYALGW